MGKRPKLGPRRPSRASSTREGSRPTRRGPHPGEPEYIPWLDALLAERQRRSEARRAAYFRDLRRLRERERELCGGEPTSFERELLVIARRRAAVEWRAAGVPWVRIARDLGVSVSSVRMKVEERSRGRRRPSSEMVAYLAGAVADAVEAGRARAGGTEGAKISSPDAFRAGAP